MRRVPICFLGFAALIGPDLLRVELPEPCAYSTARHDVIEPVRGK